MKILGIETSCDETAGAVLEVKSDKQPRFSLLSNVVSSQINIHKKYGGVVPELAARKHTENIIPVIDEALSCIKTKNKKPVDAIAVTVGPGLVTSLMVGVETAKTLAWMWQVPLIQVNHLEAHLYANWLPKNPPSPPYQGGNNTPLIRGARGVEKNKFPILCLLVSGGHTELILVKDYNKYKIIGETVDDAVGESFDKVAKMIGVEYPGGPNVAKLAKKGNPEKIDFPRPMMNSKDFNFSFSGLKTAVRQVVGKYSKADICASFQEAVIDVLIKKTIKATEKYKVKTVMLAGGVSANKKLREQLDLAVETRQCLISTVYPELQFCTDNAAMIAMAGYFKYDKKMKPYNLEKVDIDPNMGL